MKTLFRHTVCKGGPIVLNPNVKLVSPSFSVGSGGITGAMLDVQLPKNNITKPSLECSYCDCVIQERDMDTTITATCSCCNSEKVMAHLSVHDIVGVICNDCVKGILEYTSTGRCSDTQIVEFTLTLGIKQSDKFSSLKDAVVKPIHL